MGDVRVCTTTTMFLCMCMDQVVFVNDRNRLG